MYFVSKKLKKKYNITDERAALYKAAETWVDALNVRDFLEIKKMRKNPLKSSKSSLNEANFHHSMRTGMSKQKQLAEDILRYGDIKIAAEVFTFRELTNATDNFNPELFVGEGGKIKVQFNH
ncbi:PREDICTED: serine/threonine-protein kinase PBS1-like [Ipomoea nil]|uniref:serine/threonine-protein kinase PBS1-like n=1 Tax=Ipomoea nil TaxID=35883 RepID=UPI00090176C5|nr:PREDICTED: serine/threonine-protein kinase PBS1-like [Ipomoea nil]XP_019160027.1 PREDICTED: serine/threonine-protein kinase PBS1-like [Ipomoea nil]